MTDSSATLHEAADELRPETKDRHRAIVSLMEELEAVDWYQQRIDATGDPALAAILAHNRDEEKEHAAMVLEWLRRNDSRMDAELRDYLFTEGEIVDHEHEHGEAEDHAPSAAASDAGLGIGSLKGERRNG